ncbi:hypothetical protein PBY51_004863 [Eleginops maclovinus]|uniref:TFIIS N-terminal domain-containing protein n=1 Tax=Eleginops maclovinus TaxID=56733 RepID=A0AAN7X7B9_ELEMC|nr:hypothetical protein PBY51_004863 [Eleginops maclovinus]
MAEDLLETVDRLQSRLLENPEPRKLLKTLKRLGELPMTVDILVETGVGKTVNSFRKHQLAGEVAKGLVGKWKKLVPQSTEKPTNSHVNEAPRSHNNSEAPEAGGGHRRTREPSPEEEPSYMEEEEEERGGGGGGERLSHKLLALSSSPGAVHPSTAGRLPVRRIRKPGART